MAKRTFRVKRKITIEGEKSEDTRPTSPFQGRGPSDCLICVGIMVIVAVSLLGLLAG